ncbi:contractile injection system protein, VgrG/Pvc8 family [Dechloromonas denitrificans]|uniref:contractile injection system protein, VgrG/Pvc8 family n=1 Tax=Dechloromonas denitrificans TaxID=281362 RepID=UPI001CFBB0C5|nr:contractile injection system protein, VgrG/Pvc8 family [Dechloromonas denitrificans]UCV06919.1 hypothetical protein KI615_16140 [Dechloromonas denitrificans]
MEREGALAKRYLWLFADSQRFPEDVLSQSANGGQGIRYHRADSQEDQDVVLAFGEHRRLLSTLATQLGYDYKAKRSVSTSVPTAQAYGSPRAPVLESYDDSGLYAFATSGEAERYGRLAMEALEARYQTRLDLLGLPSQPDTPNVGPVGYSITEVSHLGINNLTGRSLRAIVSCFGQSHGQGG